jgi:hypothetical protein
MLPAVDLQDLPPELLAMLANLSFCKQIVGTYEEQTTKLLTLDLDLLLDG